MTINTLGFILLIMGIAGSIAMIAITIMVKHDAARIVSEYKNRPWEPEDLQLEIKSLRRAIVSRASNPYKGFNPFSIIVDKIFGCDLGYQIFTTEELRYLEDILEIVQEKLNAPPPPAPEPPPAPPKREPTKEEKMRQKINEVVIEVKAKAKTIKEIRDLKNECQEEWSKEFGSEEAKTMVEDLERGIVQTLEKL